MSKSGSDLGFLLFLTSPSKLPRENVVLARKQQVQAVMLLVASEVVYCMNAYSESENSGE